MEAAPISAAKRQNTDWLSPSVALTRFRPPENETDTTSSPSLDETVISFHIGGLNFWLAAGTHCEVIEQLQVNSLPNVKPWFSGLLNLRGNLVPVIDLRVLLGEPAGDHKKRRLLAIDKGDKTMALWIDALPQVRGAFSQPLKQLPALPAALQRYVASGHLVNGQIYLNVQFGELFSALGRQFASEEIAS